MRTKKAILIVCAIAAGCNQGLSTSDATLMQAVEGARNVYIGAADFADGGNAACTVCPGSATYNHPSGSFWQLTGTRSVVGAVTLPPGTVVHNMVVRINQAAAGAASAVLTEGVFSAVNTVAVSNVVIVTGAPAVGVWAPTPDLPDPNFVLKDGFVYEIAVGSHGAGNVGFNGVMLTVTGP
jgi:hypothetical protein